MIPHDSLEKRSEEALRSAITKSRSFSAEEGIKVIYEALLETAEKARRETVEQAIGLILGHSYGPVLSEIPDKLEKKILKLLDPKPEGS